MPEGDSAFRVARSLSQALVGRTLTEFQIRTSALAALDLTGKKVASVEAMGKHLLVRVDRWSIHSHMLMDGTWHLYRPGARWRRPDHQARIILANDQVQAVGFRVAQLKVVPLDRESALVGHLGPDPLKAEWEAGGRELAAANLLRDTRPIHVALLDQANVAGFGNEYVNEICFLMGISPLTPAANVDAERLLRLGTRLIRANRDRVERTTTGNARPGRRLHVYGKAGSPCPRCGTTVLFTRLGADPTRGRHVYYCPHCQPIVA